MFVRSQIWTWEITERLKPHNLPIVHVMVRSELEYLIGGKVVRLKCRVIWGKTSPISVVLVFVR
jgi:hypothetical protein